MDNKNLTVVYEIINESLWRESGNPLRYEHHGLKAHTAAAYDAVARCDVMRAELERLRDVVSNQDVESIDAICKIP